MKSQSLRVFLSVITLTLIVTLGMGFGNLQQEQQPKTVTQTKESQAALTPKQARKASLETDGL